MNIRIHGFLQPTGGNLPPEESSKIAYYRLLCLLGATLLLLFGGLREITAPGGTDPMWARTLLAGLLFSLFGASYTSTYVRQRYERWLHALLYLVMGWFAVLVALNDFTGDYTVGLLVLYTVILTVVGIGSRSMRPVIWFAGIGLLFTAGAAATVDVPLWKVVTVLASLITVGIVEAIATQAHVTSRLEARDQKKQLLTIADNVSDGIYRSKPGEGLLFANQAFVDMFGFGSVKEALAADPEDLYLNPERRTDLRTKAKRDGSFKDAQVTFQRTDGSQFHGLLSATVERTPDGTVKYYDGAVSDVSERIEREQIRRAREEKAAGLYRATEELLLADSPEDVATRIEELLRTTFDYPLNAVAFARDGQLVPVQVSPHVSEHIDDVPALPVDHDGIGPTAFRSGETAVVDDLQEESAHEYESFRSAACVPIGSRGLISVVSEETSGVALFDVRLIEILAAYASAVLDRLEHEEKLVAAKEEAERMNRLKSSFLANMSHEIRTPLTSIVGFAEAIREEVSALHNGTEDRDLQSLGQFAELIERGGYRLKDTLDSLLHFSKLEAGEMQLSPQPVDLDEEAQEVVDFFERKAKSEGVDLQADTGKSPVVANADPGGVRIVLRNLVSNAIKYTDEGGRARVEASREDGAVRIDVRDTGIGMAQDSVPELFEAFAQESDGFGREYEGTGLGLTITRRVVDQMGGSLSVETKKGEGSKFTVRLPAHDRVTSE